MTEELLESSIKAGAKVAAPDTYDQSGDSMLMAMNLRLSAIPLVLCAGALAGAGQNSPMRIMPPEIKKLAYEIPNYSFVETSDGPHGASLARGLEVGSDIFVIDAQNAKPRKLVSGGSRPVWSPDGSQVAYCTWKGVGVGQIEVANADGTGKRQITNMKGGACFPDWSPDGTKIVFTALRIGDSEKNLLGAKNTEIFVVNKNGGNPLPIAPGFAARWSPVGTMLLFLRGPEKHGPNSSVWMATPYGGDTKMVAVSDGGIEGAAWLPDGKGIAVSSYRDLRYSVFRINLDDAEPQGNQPQRIVDDARANWYAPSVSPDGRHLIAITDCTRAYWNADSKCTGFAIVLMDIHTNKSTTLAAGTNYSVVWERK